MKTPEEMAEEFAAINGRYDPLNANCRWGKNAFIGGYKAAQEHAHAALEEAEARIQELQDRLMEESGGRLRLFKDDADAKAAYQECLEEVELDKAWQEGYKAAQDQLADADKVMPDTCEHILDMEKMVDVNGWISVKDRLPELWNDYLAFGYGPTIPASCFVAVYDPKSNKWYDMHTDWDWSDVITHWQELPEPPKEEE